MKPVAALLLFSLTALPVAAAAPQEKGDVSRLQAEFRDEQARARRLRAEAADAAAEIVRLERELASLRTAVSADDALIRAQRVRLTELGAREAAITAQLATARGRQARLLSALQMMSRRPPPPLLVPADKAVDTVRASILMRAIAPELQARARGAGGSPGRAAGHPPSRRPQQRAAVHHGERPGRPARRDRGPERSQGRAPDRVAGRGPVG